MNYFRINLHKLEDQGLLLRRLWRRNLWFMLAVIVAGFFFWTMLQTNRAIGKKVRALTEMSAGLEKQIRELEESVSFISEDDVGALSDMNNQRIFWTAKLESLATLAGEEIALTSLRFQRSKLAISGIARAAKNESRFSLISGLIERIKADGAFSRDFASIEFVSSNKADVLGQNILNFEILCHRR